MSKLYQFTIGINDKAYSVMKRLGYATAEVEAKFKSAGQQGRDAMGRFTAKAKEADDSISKLGRTVGSLFAAHEIWNFGKSILTLGANMEQTRISFETMLGSRAVANKLIGDISEMASKTPFGKQALLDAGQLLLNFGVTADKIMPSLKMLGDISGGNEQKLQSLTLAFAQMNSAGRLMGQDLLQMINAGFNPLQEISARTGKSMGELKEQMEKGGISSEMVIGAFKSATSEGGRFFNMMNKQSQTSAGLWSTLKDNVAEAMTKIGTAGLEWLKPYLQGAIVLTGQIIPAMKAVMGFIEKWGFTLAMIGGAISAYYAKVLVVNAITKAWTVYQWLLNAAMTANPIGIIIVAIGALVGAIIYAWMNFEKFRGTIYALWESFKQVFVNIGQLISNFVQKTLAPFIEAWENIKAGKYTEAAKSLGKGVLNLTPVGLYENLLKDIPKVANGVADAWTKGMEKGVSQVQARKEKTAEQNATETATGETPFTPLATETELNKGVDNIAGGGAKQTHITVSFENLIRENNINVNGVKQGVDDMTDQLINGLLRVLNSANAMASN